MKFKFNFFSNKQDFLINQMNHTIESNLTYYFILHFIDNLVLC
jgi:hypothetical protein